MPSETTSPWPEDSARGDATGPAPSRSTATETFRYQVSAGEQLAPAREPIRATRSADRSAVKPAAGYAPTAITRISSPKAIKRITRTPAWLGSLLVNCGILTGMALISISGIPQGFDFTLSFSADSLLVDEPAITEVAIDAFEDLSVAESQLTSEVEQTAALADGLEDEVSLANFAGSAVEDSPLSDAADLFAAQGGGLAEMMPSGDKLTASFFGTKVDGRRILYILDNSGGMQDGGLEVLIDELIRSVDSLSTEQQFYVVFYSDMVYQLFHPHPPEKFVPANDRFKRRLKAWLNSVEFCVGNSVDEAIQLAAMIRPDAVYLLTDGDVDTTQDGRKLAALVDNRGRDFPIHTFLIGNKEESKAADNLRLVAEANQGTFRTVPVTSEARERAKKAARPYHNKEPGPVWGLNVGRGWGRR